MQPQKNPNAPPEDPRAFVRASGAQKLSDVLRTKGRYLCQARPLVALEKALRRSKPLLCEGERGCGKTQLAKSLALAFNLPVASLSCMHGLEIKDVLYEWETTAQDQFVRQATDRGMELRQAQTEQWSREFLKLGTVLEAFDYVTRSPFPPVTIIDEIDKLDDKGEDMLLQIMQDNYVSVPRLSPDPRVGVLEPDGLLPILILTSNNMRSGVSSPLRSRCYYTYIKSATPQERVQILSTQVPAATPKLLAQTTKMMRYIVGMGGVHDKPALREAIDFLKTLVDEGVGELSSEIFIENLCCLAKREKDVENMAGAAASMMLDVEAADDEIDAWAKQAYETTNSYMLVEAL